MNEKDLDEIIEKPLYKTIKDYVFNKKRLKAIGILGGTIAAVAIFKDKMPVMEQYFQQTFSCLSNKAIALAVDTTTYTVCAPLGFLMSNYAHDKKVTKKEIIGHIVYSAAWSVFRHYVYSGLSNFEEVNSTNVSLKIGLYTGFYTLAVGSYAIFSDYWHKMSNGVKSYKALKEIPSSLKKLKNLLIDPNLQYNLVLNLVNMFNPWIGIRPTLAAALTIDQNMNVVKHSHGRKYGLCNYIKEIFKS